MKKWFKVLALFLLIPVALLVLVSCNKKEITGLEFADASYVYDGETHSLALVGAPEGATVTYDANSFKDAGEYTVTVTVELAKYETAVLSAKLTISKATYDMSGIGFADASYVYDGIEKKLEISGSLPQGVKVSYTANTLKEVGTIEVTASFSGDSKNYNLIPDKKASLSITNSAYDMSGIKFENASYVYDGIEKKLEISGKLPDGVSVSYSTNVLTDVGHVEVTASFLGDYKNFNKIADMKATLEITKAKAFMNTDKANLTFTYDGLTHKVANITGSGDVSYVGNSGYTNVGTYDVTVKVAESANYFAGEFSVEEIINRADISASISFVDQAFDYDGLDHSLVIDGSLPSGCSASYSANNKQINAGSYKVTVSFSLTDNYVAIASKSATLTINKVKPSINTNGVTLSYSYDGSAKVLSGATVEGDGEISYLVNGAAVVSLTDAGTYQVTVSAKESKNYLAETKVITIIINKATQTIAYSGAVSFTYDGSTHSISGATSNGDGAISYEGNSFTDAGEYKVIVKAAETSSYAPATLEVKITVNKAEQVITYSGATSFPYNLLSQSITGATSNGDGAISYEGNSFTDAGEYNVTINAKETANYKSQTKVVSIKVTKIDYDMSGVNFEDASYVYNGSERVLLLTGKALASFIAPVYSNNKITDVGSRNATVVFTVNSINYNAISSKSATITVTQADPELSIADSARTFTYDGTAKSIKSSDISISGSPVFTIDEATNSKSQAGTYVVKVHANQTANYKAADLTINLVINKADIKGITVESSEYVYDGVAHSVAITNNFVPAETALALSTSYLVTSDYSEDGTMTSGSYFNRGIYAYTLTFKCLNYNDLVISGNSLTIVQATPVVDLSGVVLTYTYNGSEQKVNSGYVTNSDAPVLYSGNTFKAAGTYSLVIGTAMTRNFKAASDTLTVTVNKATFEAITFEDIPTLTYRVGLSVPVSITNDLTNVLDSSADQIAVSYFIALNGGTEEAGNTITKAGTYVIRAHFTVSGGNYNEIADVSKTVEVQKGNIKQPRWVDGLDGSFTYSVGFELVAKINHDDALITSALDSVTVTYTMVRNSRETINGNVINHAGEYKVTASFNVSGGNFNDIDSDTIMINVAKATYSATLKPINSSWNDSLSKYVSTYNGIDCSFEMVDALPSDGGIIVAYTSKYHSDAEYEEVSSRQKAGLYDFKATFTVSDDWNAVSEIAFVLEISKASYDLSGITFEDVTGTYFRNALGNETEFVALIGGTLPDGVAIDHYEENTRSVAGTQTANVYFRVVDAENYEVPSSMSAVITVNKATPDAVAFPNSLSLVYGNALSTLDCSSQTGDGTFAWEDSSLVLHVTHNKPNMVFTPRDYVNYDYSSYEGFDAATGLITRALDVTVNRAPLSITLDHYLYNGGADHFTYEETIVDANVTWKLVGLVNGDAISVIKGTPYISFDSLKSEAGYVKAGTHSVHYIVNDESSNEITDLSLVTDDYSLTLEVFALEVSKKQLAAPSITFETDGGIKVSWNAISHATSYTVFYEGTLSGKSVSSHIDGISALTYTVTSTRLDLSLPYNITVKAEEDVNYSESAASNVVAKLQPANIYIKDGVVVWDAVPNASGYQLTYNGSAYSLSASTLSYDFSDSSIPAGNVTFSMITLGQANVTVNSSSVSKTFVKLSTPSTSVANSICTWTKIDNATSYAWAIYSSGFGVFTIFGDQDTIQLPYGVITYNGAKQYGVRANGGSGYLNSAATSIQLTPLANPVNVAVSNNKFTWDAVVNATGYTLYFHDATTDALMNTIKVSEASYTITDEIVEGSYKLYVQATHDETDAANYTLSDLSQALSFERLGKVTNLRPSINTIAFDSPAACTCVMLSYKNNDDAYSEYAQTRSTTTDGMPNKSGSFSFKVYAKGNGSDLVDSIVSEFTGFTRLATPVVSISEGILSWTAIAGAASYNVDIKVGSGSVVTKTVTGTTIYLFSDIDETSSVLIGVRADGSDSSKYISSFLGSCTLTKLGETKLTINNGRLEWTAVASAETYTISFAGVTSKTISGITDCYYELGTDFASGLYTSISIIAKGTDSEKEVDGNQTTVYDVTKLAKADSSSINATSAGRISALDITNAQSYDLLIDGSVYDFKSLSYDPTNYNLSGALNVAYRANGGSLYLNGDYSDNEVYNFLAAPVVSITNEAIVWDEVTGATRYQLYIDDVLTGKDLTVNSYSVSGYTEAGHHTVFVYADVNEANANSYIDSGRSNVIMFYRLTVPSNFAIKSGVFTWNLVVGSTGYIVKIGSTTYQIDSQTKTSFLDPSVATFSTVSVQAKGNGTTYMDSAFSASISNATRISKPAISLVNGAVAWTANSKATGYLVQASSDDFANIAWSETKSDNTIVNSTLLGLAPDTDYSVRIMLLGDDTYLNSQYSNVVTVNKLSVAYAIVSEKSITFTKNDNATGIAITSLTATYNSSSYVFTGMYADATTVDQGAYYIGDLNNASSIVVYQKATSDTLLTTYIEDLSSSSYYLDDASLTDTTVPRVSVASVTEFTGATFVAYVIGTSTKYIQSDPYIFVKP